MRANGVAEKYCTGEADALAKFLAWAGTVPHTLRNPLYHWTHLELKRYFGIDELLDEQSAARIWHKANEQLARPELSTRGILKKFNVTTLCTTDDPTDDLAHHEKIAADGLATAVFPAFRPDKALGVHQPEAFNKWVARLEQAADTDIGNLEAFIAALRRRHDYFHAHGCRLSDHGLNQCLASPCTDKSAAAIFAKARRGQAASPAEHAQFGTHLMLCFGRWDAEKGWTKQLHLGALRNNNTRLLAKLGPDTGFDSIGDFPQARRLARLPGPAGSRRQLPKMIVYNINPADNYVFATMIGQFPGRHHRRARSSSAPAGGSWTRRKASSGSSTPSPTSGLLSRFVGMITDSRSFMSYPRHEYFRRVLCNLIGADMERGELPNDEALLGP